MGPGAPSFTALFDVHSDTFLGPLPLLGVRKDVSDHQRGLLVVKSIPHPSSVSRVGYGATYVGTKGRHGPSNGEGSKVSNDCSNFGGRARHSSSVLAMSTDTLYLNRFSWATSQDPRPS